MLGFGKKSEPAAEGAKAVTDMLSMDPAFPPAHGMQYYGFLGAMHAHLEPDWYLEIGTAQGGSLVQSKSKTIAIDPKFQIKEGNLGHRPETHLFEMTSDDFFEQKLIDKLTPKIDLAFLDGMHLFEFLLRDFINTEKYCTSDSIIVLHDLVPPTYQSAEREWDRSLVKLWTGDVWKVAVILKEYRPDLTLRVANCRPTGLGIVTGMDSTNTVLSDRYDEIVARFDGMTMQDYGEAALAALLDMRKARSHHFYDIIGQSGGAAA